MVTVVELAAVMAGHAMDRRAESGPGEFVSIAFVPFGFFVMPDGEPRRLPSVGAQLRPNAWHGVVPWSPSGRQ